jgi:hypothetical protein
MNPSQYQRGGSRRVEVVPAKNSDLKPIKENAPIKYRDPEIYKRFGAGDKIKLGLSCLANKDGGIIQVSSQTSLFTFDEMFPDQKSSD